MSLLPGARPGPYAVTVSIGATAEAHARTTPVIGRSLGPYEVVAKLGEGGMGQVYRARDTKLNRDVAIKVLPEIFATDPERLARFTREAQTLASLNHPNIAAVYAVEDRAIVMELVDGEDLSAHIQRGPMPAAECLPIARQVADALAAAHEAGIVHRDLKPANIKVRDDGTVKVLDFGLAKATGPEGSDAADPSHSPTLTARATEMGVILGTAAYMAPEQARGKAVDRRADVWAFGLVLLEMLTGRRAFEGAEVTDILAAVIRDAPPFESLPPGTPAPIRRLLRRCLEKDRARRLDSMRAATLDIDDALAGVGDTTSAASAVPAGSGRSRRLLERPALLAAAALLLVAGSIVATGLLRPPRAAEPVTRMTIGVEADGQRFETSGLALSADGSMLVFIVSGSGASNLYLRRRHELHATPIPGTAGAASPFLSPDSRWVGFFAGGSLKKVSLSGGTPSTLCAAGYRRGAAWAEDGRIVFSSGNAPGLMAVPDGGGEPVALTSPGSGEEHFFPSLLPGGRGVLFTISTGNTPADKYIGFHSFKTGETERLILGTTAMYVAPGYLVFGRLSELWAARFDLDSLKVTSDPVPVVKDVLINPGGRWAQYAASWSGTLAYEPVLTGLQPVVIEGDTETPIATEGRTPDEFRIAPDGRSIALEAEGEVWTLDLQQGTFSRVTTASDPIWTPDGTRLTVVTADGITVYPLDERSAPKTIAPKSSTTFLGSWSRDGRFLAYEEQTDIWTWSADTGKAAAWLSTPFRTGKPEFSPNGRWLAYVSDESGETNAYVRPFPGPGREVRVSSAGGREAAWAPDGRRLYFRRGADLVAVGFDPDSGVVLGRPELVLTGRNHYTSGTSSNRYYDLMPNGRGIIVLRAPNADARIHVAYNWVEELKTALAR